MLCETTFPFWPGCFAGMESVCFPDGQAQGRMWFGHLTMNLAQNGKILVPACPGQELPENNCCSFFGKSPSGIASGGINQNWKTYEKEKK